MDKQNLEKRCLDNYELNAVPMGLESKIIPWRGESFELCVHSSKGSQPNESLFIADYESDDDPDEGVKKQANKILAGWLIEHWLKKKTRKNLISRTKAVSYDIQKCERRRVV